MPHAMNSRAKLLVFVPNVWPDVSGRHLLYRVRSLVTVAEAANLEVTLLATNADLAGRPLPWPTSVHRYIRQLPPKQYQANSLPPVTFEAFEQLEKLAPTHDLIYLPQPFGALPSETRLSLPIPVLMGFDSFPFDREDYGSRTDRFHREMERLVEIGTRFFFPTESLRRQGVRDYAIPSHRTRVIAPTGELLRGDPEQVRRRYKLPREYALSVGWRRCTGPSGLAARALAHMKREGKVALPFVGLSEPMDVAPLAGADQKAANAEIRRELDSAGLVRGRDWFDLERIDAEELSGLILGASVYLGEQDVDWYALCSERSGVPTVHPESVEEFAEALTLGLDSSRGSSSSVAPHGNDEAEALLDEFRGVLRLGDRAYLPLEAKGSVPREKRVAWFISHTTLRDAEIPLLRELGYEVYTNKVLPSGEDFRSGSTDFSWDHGSTLPTAVLNYLNSYNFYQKELDPEMAATLNAYFGTLVMAAYPLMMREAVKHFRGKIYIRVFGREHPLTYSEYFNCYGDGWFWKRCWEIRHRFWIASCYDTIPLIEKKFVRDRSVLLGVAMPERCVRMAGQWRGGDRRVFFVCPSIKTAAHYYGQIYERFKEVYGDLPHLIGGSQPIAVHDHCVTGFLSDEEYHRLYCEMQVMYYHSREPRHIHYHPLEAILYGMPVVYMRGGLMEAFDTGSQAGACDTDEEARDKLQRVLDGDVELIRQIQESQITILNEFMPEKILADWRRVFHEGTTLEPVIADVRPARTLVPLESERLVRESKSDTEELVRLDLIAFFAEEPEAETVVEPVVIEACLPVVPVETVLNRRQQIKKRVKELLPAPLVPVARQVFHGLKWSRRTAKRMVGRGEPGAEAPSMDWEVLPLPKAEPLLPALSAQAHDERYLNDPPDGPTKFDELRPFRDEPMTLPELRDLLRGMPTALVVDPVGTLDPNVPVEQLRRENLVVAFTDLRWEFGDVFGEWTEIATREAMLWCQMAARVVLTSETDRRLAVERYDVDPGRAVVRPVLSLIELPPAVDGAAVRLKFGLPSEYLLGSFSDSPQVNSTLLFQGLEVLRRRGAVVPPLVLMPPIPVSPAERKSATVAKLIEELKHKLGLEEGKNLFSLGELSPGERAGLIAGAALLIDTHRGTGLAAKDLAVAMSRRVPVIACDSPLMRVQWGQSGAGLSLIHPDDPVALANAIRRMAEERSDMLTVRRAA